MVSVVLQARPSGYEPTREDPKPEATGVARAGTAQRVQHSGSGAPGVGVLGSWLGTQFENGFFVIAAEVLTLACKATLLEKREERALGEIQCERGYAAGEFSRKVLHLTSPLPGSK